MQQKYGPNAFHLMHAPVLPSAPAPLPPVTQPVPPPPPPKEMQSTNLLNQPNKLQDSSVNSISTDYANHMISNINSELHSEKDFNYASANTIQNNDNSMNLESNSEENGFDEQFKKWENEFSSWKKQNANHPDKKAYIEYEAKMEECRSKLLDRREQMRRRKKEKCQTGNKLHMDDIENSLIEAKHNHSDQNIFNTPIMSSSIPGLDLIVKNDAISEKITYEIDDQNEENFKKDVNDAFISQSNQNLILKRSNLDEISRGINNILCDTSLLSLLSNIQKPIELEKRQNQLFEEIGIGNGDVESFKGGLENQLCNRKIDTKSIENKINIEGNDLSDITTTSSYYDLKHPDNKQYSTINTANILTENDINVNNKNEKFSTKYKYDQFHENSDNTSVHYFKPMQIINYKNNLQAFVPKKVVDYEHRTYDNKHLNMRSPIKTFDYEHGKEIEKKNVQLMDKSTIKNRTNHKRMVCNI